LEAVQAYSVLANQGIMMGQPNLENFAELAQDTLSPVSILQIMSVDGQARLDWTIPHMLPVVTRQIAYLTTNVLSDEKVRDSSFGHWNSVEIDRPAAIKLSLRDDANNAWTIGYIPQLSVGVWLGNTQGNLGGITAEMPAGLWHAVVTYASSEMRVQDFSVPTGISLVQVCSPSGLLISTLCPNIVQEVFLNGNEPTQVDNLYQKYAIDRATGKLATVFTPSAMVEEKVFMVVPPQAKAWAADAGIEIPPDTYDSIVAPQTISADVQISAPQLFDHVRGKIDISWQRRRC
jgi:membrane carboxypeptidase/penicillin-binding protein